MLVSDDRRLEPDRRIWPRIKIDRPCKVFDPRSMKYLAGQAINVSSGGALIEIDRPLDIAPGESLHVGIAQKRRQMFIRTREMLQMRIVRAMGTPDGTTVLAGEWVEHAATAIEAAVPMRRAA